MKTGFWLSFVCGFVFFASIIFVQQTVLSSAASDRPIITSVRVAPVELLPLVNPQSLTPVEQAYLDSFSILHARFF